MATTRNTKITGQLTNLSTTEEGKIVTADSIAIISLVNAAGEYTEVKRVKVGDLYSYAGGEWTTEYVDALNDLATEIAAGINAGVVAGANGAVNTKIVLTTVDASGEPCDSVYMTAEDADEIGIRSIDADGNEQLVWRLMPNAKMIVFRILGDAVEGNSEDDRAHFHIHDFAGDSILVREFSLGEIGFGDDFSEGDFQDALEVIAVEIAAELGMDADGAGSDSSGSEHDKGWLMWNVVEK